jgi:hypothetical protein
MPGRLNVGWKNEIRKRIEFAGFVISLVSLAGLLAKWHWLADLLCQFRVQYASLLLILTIALLFFHRCREC